MREVRKRCRRDQFRAARHVPIGIFDHQIDVASFIYIVEEGKGRRQNEYANASE
jgi:hypothetical protein